MEEFNILLNKTFGDCKTNDNCGFTFRYGNLTVVGALAPICEKTNWLKQYNNIPNETWVCHYYYTNLNGKYLGEKLATTFDEMMETIKYI